MIAHYLLEPEMRHNMNYLAETYLDYSPVKIEELIGKKGSGQGTMRDVPLEQIKEYAAEDADITLQLRQYLEPKLDAGGQSIVKLFHLVETPLVKVLADIEFAGVRIDKDFLNEYSKELIVSIEALERKVLEETGLTFNVSSPKQVGEVLFDRLKLPYPGKKMKSGQYSTDEEVLSVLAVEYPICADILQHRTLAKLRSTYVEALPALINPRTGRVHSSFNQALAATGRLSSQNPNLQNIPIRTAEGRRVREAFIPRDADHVLLSADYSQIELRLIADMSHEEAMLEAFQLNQDIHQATAARVFGVPLENVTPEQRRAAKTVNFSIIYGAGATNLSNQLGIKRTEAKELIDNYFAQYRGLKHYMDTTVEFARKHGYVETLLGRRRYLRDIRQPQWHEPQHGRAHGRQHAHSGHCRRHDQSSHGQYLESHARGKSPFQHDPAGTRRTRVRCAQRRIRHPAADHPRKNDDSHTQSAGADISGNGGWGELVGGALTKRIRLRPRK
jgi:DNA polymerase I